MNKIIDIQTNHTYSDYRRFFGYEYDKGKILSFTKDQYEYMNPDRQYWELKDEDGVIKYFELPKHVKPFTQFSPYCFTRIFHRRPARTAMLILGGLFVTSVTCSFVAQKVFGTNDFNVNVDAAKLDECAMKYREWLDNGNNPKLDDINNSNFTVASIAGMAMGNFLYDTSSGNPVLRPNILTVGHGHSDTNIIISHVLVDISNNFQQITGEDGVTRQLEESLSYGTMSLTRFAKRDYFDGNDTVSAYHGAPNSSKEASWNDKLIKEYTKQEYMDLVGKNPAQPFLYNITDETVLTDKVYDEDYETGAKHFGNSSCVAIKDKNNLITGYKIELDLHNVKSVTRYVKRMTYLSGQTPNRFNSIHMSFVTDENLMLKSSYVKEDYIITLMQSGGWFDTRYYVGEEETLRSEITPYKESFDYSKYKF